MRKPIAPPHDPHFRVPVYGTVFGRRTEVVHRLQEGDQLMLIPDPPGVDNPNVWVHARGGDVVGHMPMTVGRWLAPWMLQGGRCRAVVDRLHSDEVESWRRVIVEVTCW